MRDEIFCFFHNRRRLQIFKLKSNLNFGHERHFEVKMDNLLKSNRLKVLRDHWNDEGSLNALFSYQHTYEYQSTLIHLTDRSSPSLGSRLGRVTRIETQNFVGNGVAFDRNQSVKLFQGGNINHFAPELGTYEGPRHPDERLKPKCGMNDVTAFQ